MGSPAGLELLVMRASQEDMGRMDRRVTRENQRSSIVAPLW